MDQDDSMLSSPSSQDDEAYDEDNLFPEHNELGRPQTPQNDHLNAAAPGELSPPRSQSTNINDDAAIRSRIPQLDDSEDLSPTAANRTLMSMEEEWKPGQGWKTKKAQEDMQRAWDYVVDKDFNIRDYGDVMSDRMSK